MDENNRRDALEVAHAVAHGRSSAQLARLLDFAPEQPLRDVPDPYYGKDADFAQVVALIETGVRGFIAAQLAASAR
jgi:protein-tyrosine phosphatase